MDLTTLTWGDLKPIFKIVWNLVVYILCKEAEMDGEEFYRF